MSFENRFSSTHIYFVDQLQLSTSISEFSLIYFDNNCSYTKEKNVEKKIFLFSSGFLSLKYNENSICLFFSHLNENDYARS